MILMKLTKDNFVTMTPVRYVLNHMIITASMWYLGTLYTILCYSENGKYYLLLHVNQKSITWIIKNSAVDTHDTK